MPPLNDRSPARLTLPIAFIGHSDTDTTVQLLMQRAFNNSPTLRYTLRITRKDTGDLPLVFDGMVKDAMVYLGDNTDVRNLAVEFNLLDGNSEPTGETCTVRYVDIAEIGVY